MHRYNLIGPHDPHSGPSQGEERVLLLDLLLDPVAGWRDHAGGLIVAHDAVEISDITVPHPSRSGELLAEYVTAPCSNIVAKVVVGAKGVQAVDI